MKYSLAELRQNLTESEYICSEETLLTVYLALNLEKPLLIEGPPGVGKTEMAKALSRAFHTQLIRLQCYEGLDENKALYEWNYQRQILKIQLSKELEEKNLDEEDLFSPEYLLERPLLKAIRSEERPVLLIDEVDKCDQEFEAFLFEILSDFQVSIPELGTMEAKQIPMVVLTSNNERELSDGLKRRCVYLYLDFPSVEMELEIIQRKVPAAPEKLTRQIVELVNCLRDIPEIRKKPSIAETLDWTRALVSLNSDRLDDKLVHKTLNLLLKTRGDQKMFREQLEGSSLTEYLQAGGRR